jgi:hypothetical protein
MVLYTNIDVNALLEAYFNKSEKKTVVRLKALVKKKRDLK